MIRQKVL